jgi:hypothetical protein
MNPDQYAEALQYTTARLREGATMIDVKRELEALLDVRICARDAVELQRNARHLLQ